MTRLTQTDFQRYLPNEALQKAHALVKALANCGAHLGEDYTTELTDDGIQFVAINHKGAAAVSYYRDRILLKKDGTMT
jgi:hypothetical protein